MPPFPFPPLWVVLLAVLVAICVFSLALVVHLRRSRTSALNSSDSEQSESMQSSESPARPSATSGPHRADSQVALEDGQDKKGQHAPLAYVPPYGLPFCCPILILANACSPHTAEKDRRWPVSDYEHHVISASPPPLFFVGRQGG